MKNLNYDKCEFYNSLENDWKKGIKIEGCIYPHYGLAPHIHIGKSFIGSTKFIEKSEWPENFKEDPESEGCGTYECPHNYICRS